MTSKASKQCFLNSYKKSLAFTAECTTKGKDSMYYARCTLCESDIYIGASGARDIKRHQKSIRHCDKEKNHKQQGGSLHKFFKPQQSTEELEKEKALAEKVTRAEIKMVNLIADLNLSINAADTLTEAFKDMFEDSVIAARFSCKRTKATAMIKDIAKDHKHTLMERMKTCPFSLATDGSNDSNAKLYPIVVRTLNVETCEVQSEVVSLPVLDGSATGENIFNLLDALLREGDIPWTNCISFGCDNASVMTGVHKGVISFIKKKNPECFLSGYTLHLVHLAAEKAADKLPSSPADLLVDIHYYMKKSSVRQANLGKYQEYYGQEQRGVLKHVSTRWLSIGRCLDRLVADWPALRDFFKEEKDKNTKPGTAAHKKASSIHEHLNSHTARLCALFLTFAVRTFQPFLTKHQSEAPQIQSLHENINRLMKEVLQKFVKPSAMVYKSSCDVDYKLAYNLKEHKDIQVGSEVEAFMKVKNVVGKKRDDFFKSVISYYQSVCDYLKDNLPHSNNFLKKVASVNPSKFVDSGAIDNLKGLMAIWPILIPTDSTQDEVINQLQSLQIVLLEKDSLPSPSDDIGQFWGKLAQQEDLRTACLFLLGLLVVPHSSASCERVFSYVRKIKTDQRSLMGDQMLEALIICKHMPGSARARLFSSDRISYLKGSCSRHLALKD